jgi:hypothetical protein
MPGINLFSLSVPELRRLLNVARDRGDPTLVEQLTAELEARGAPSATRPQAPAPAEDEASERMMWREAPMPPPFDIEAPAPRRSAPFGALALAAGGLASIAFFWGLRGEAPTRAPVLQTAQAQPVEAARAMTALSAPVTPVPVAAPQPPAEPLRTVTPPQAKAAAPIRVAKAEPAAVGRNNQPCANPPTAADRLVCGDLGLTALHYEMREAYVRALNAHADPEVVDEGQTEWRRARDKATDADQLARLYDQRIRELNEAASDARAGDPPY